MTGHNKQNYYSNNIAIGSIVTKELAEEVDRQDIVILICTVKKLILFD
jgi:hypothetical protein